MILNNWNESSLCLAAQVSVCAAAYRYVGLLLDTFTADCIYVVLNSTVPKESCDKALEQLISMGAVEIASTQEDGTVRYRLVK